MSNPIFNSPLSNPFGLSDIGDAASPTFADIDGDGDLDIFIGTNIGETRFYRNTGNASNPSFIAEGGTTAFGLPDVGLSANPTFVDIDNDSDLDVFIGELSGNSFFYRNTGSVSNPNFVAEGGNTPFGLADVGNYASPTLVDIDGDGDKDAFVGNWLGRTLFYRNTGSVSNPSFAAEGGTSPFGLGGVGSNATPTFADIDGDGDKDVFIGNNNGDILFYRNAGSVSVASFVPEGGFSPFGIANFASFTSPTLADIDGDGDLDLIVGNNDGNTLVYKNIVNTAPVVALALSNQSANKNTLFTYSIASNSFTDSDVGDTLTYTATQSDGSALPSWLSFNSASQTFSGTASAAGVFSISVKATDNMGANVSSTFSLTVTATVTAYNNQLSDFNADGKSDLLWTQTDGSVYAMLLDGVNAVGGGLVYSAIAQWQVLNSKGDYNGDGKTDLLLWNSTTSSAYIAHMNGGVISSEGAVDWAQNITDWTIVDSTADYNNDNKSDLLLWNNTTSSLYLALENGLSASSSVQLFTDIAGWTVKSAGGDYNGDGNSDILLWNSSTGSAYMVTMNGLNITAQGFVAEGLPSDWSIADAKGDYNGDGNSDILFRNAVTGELWQYLMNGTSISSSASIATISTTYQILSAHNDFNADGKADILWKNTADNAAWVSLVDGNGITSSVNLGAYTNWTVQNADNDVNADGKADVLWTNTDGSAYVMEMDGVSIIGQGALGPYSGWTAMV